MLEGVKTDRLSVEDAVARLRDLPYQDLGFARLDRHRELRTGFPEVVFGRGKTPDQVAALAKAMLQTSDRLLVTHATREMLVRVAEEAPDAVYDQLARTIAVDRREDKRPIAHVALASAGTSDGPIAQEAAVTAELMGCEVERFNDVGVAGIHRLFDSLPALREARVIVAVAGMEGALPSVIAGLVKVPVIAVPTSVGYGASFGGLAALLGALNSCAPGVAVVNIDNGFGAGYLAALIAKAGADES